MRIGMCCGIEQVADAQAAGYAYVELNLAATLGGANDDEYARLRAAMLSLPLPIEAFNCFLPGELKVVGPAVDLPAVERYMARALARAAEVGTAVVVFGSGAARAVPEGFPPERAREQLLVAARLAGDIAAGHQLIIAMEPLWQCPLLQRVNQGIAFVDELHHPQVRLLGDLFHMAHADEPFTSLCDAGARLVHMHLATPALPGLAAERTYDYPGFLTTLVQSGYHGRLTLEDNPGVLRGMTPPFTTVYRELREYVESTLARGATFIV